MIGRTSHCERGALVWKHEDQREVEEPWFFSDVGVPKRKLRAGLLSFGDSQNYSRGIERRFMQRGRFLL